MKVIQNIIFRFAENSRVKNIPYLKEFAKKVRVLQNFQKSGLSFYIETYGCQMNTNDSQIVRSVLSSHFIQTDNEQKANIILLNTCAIRQSAQQKIHSRIKQIGKSKVIGVLGCMAERLKQKMFKEGVHIVCGPDGYRQLPKLIDLVLQQNTPGLNIQLSAQQTYADITPIRKDKHNVSAYLSIMRGCNNMCSFCIVPFVRGRQRSRKCETILSQIQQLQKQGVKQIIFLGQNVNSYHDINTEFQSEHHNSEGFQETFKTRSYPGVRFANLLQKAASQFPNIRFRFTSPHPKDFPIEVLQAIAKYPNICKYIHLPVQSGNDQILMKMRRNHTRQAYVNLVNLIRSMIPNVSFSTDLIAGFCGETQEQFNDTLSLLQIIKYDMAFMFAYSLREKTYAHRTLKDDVPEEIKKRRLKQLIDKFISIQKQLNQKEVGSYHLLLLQGFSKRETNVLLGKTDTYKNGYVKKEMIPVYKDGEFIERRQFKIGDYVIAKVQRAGSRSLYCQPLAIAQTIKDYQHYLSKYLVQIVM